MNRLATTLAASIGVCACGQKTNVMVATGEVDTIFVKDVGFFKRRREAFGRRD